MQYSCNYNFLNHSNLKLRSTAFTCGSALICGNYNNGFVINTEDVASPSVSFKVLLSFYLGFLDAFILRDI